MIFGRARLFGKPLSGAPINYDTKLLKTVLCFIFTKEICGGIYHKALGFPQCHLRLTDSQHCWTCSTHTL